MEQKERRIKVCHGRACTENFGKYTFERARAELKIENLEGGTSLDKKFIVEKCSCLGRCEQGPNVKIEYKGKERILNKCTPIKIAEEISRMKGK